MNRYILALVLMLLVGCTDSAVDDDVKSDAASALEGEAGEVGYLSFSDMELAVDLAAESIGSDMEQSAATRGASSVDDFVVEITWDKFADSLVYSTSYAELKALDSVALYPGIYTILVKSEESCPEVAWDNPYYEDTQSVVIESGRKSSMGDMICVLSNIKASISFNASVQDMFKADEEADVPLSTTITVGGNSQLFSRTETRCAYFKAEQSSNVMSVAVAGEFNVASEGEEPNYLLIEDWSEVISSDVKAGEWRKILLKINGAYDGSVEFELTVDSWYYDEPLMVDIMRLSYPFYAYGEESIVDPDDTASHEGSPVVSYADNSSVVDGWFIIEEESFNFDAESVLKPLSVTVTPTSGSTVESLSLAITSSSEALIEALTAAGLDSNSIELLPSSSISDFVTLRCDATSGVVTLTLKNAAMFSLYENFVGDHTVVVTAIDEQSRRSFTTLQISVQPTLSIEWAGGYDFDTRYSLPDDDLEVVIVVTSASGLTGLTVEIESPVLTHEELSGINLSSYMDMVNPESDLMEAGLNSMGFMTGDDVVGCTYMVIDITEFMGALASLGEGDFNTDFILTATDETGSVTRRIKLYVE